MNIIMLFKLALVIVLLFLTFVLVLSALIEFNNEHLRAMPAPAKLAPTQQTFIKSTIWPEYLNYLKTGQRINSREARAAWAEDNNKYTNQLNFGNFSVVSWNVNC